MGDKADKKAKSAEMVAEAYERYGFTRVTLAGRLGLATETIRHVEKGRQAFGSPSFARMEQLLAQLRGRRPALCEDAAPYEEETPSVGLVVDMVLDEDLQPAARKVADALGCPLREAMEIVVRKKIEQRRKGL